MPSPTPPTTAPTRPTPLLPPSLGLEAIELGRWLDTLPMDLVQPLMSAAKPRSYRKGDVLFRKGERAEGIYFIDSGEVSAYTATADGREYMLYLFEPGSCVGIVSTLDDAVSPSTGRAYSDCRVRFIDGQRLRDMLEREPRYYRYFLDLMLRWVRGLLSLLEDTAVLGVRARLAKRLLQLAYIYGHPGDDGIVIPFKLSQDDWALFLGATRQSIHQQLKRFRTCGWISIGHGHVVLLDTEALVACISSERSRDANDTNDAMSDDPP